MRLATVVVIVVAYLLTRGLPDELKLLIPYNPGAGVYLVLTGALMRRASPEDAARDRAAGQPDRCDLGRHDECRVRQPSRTDLRVDRYRNGLGPLAKAAWTGAIVSNILVVNGAAMVVAGLRFGRIRFSMERAQDVGASLMIASVAIFLPSIYAESRRHLPTPQMSIDYLHRSLHPAPDPLRCRNGSHRTASKGADLAGHGRNAQPARTERRCDEHGVGDRAACHFQPAGGASVGLRRRLGRRRQTEPRLDRSLGRL
jgi:hypothetical protein